jgi:hypothetical protein
MSMEEILVEIMAKRVMYVGIHASSIRGLKASPSNGRRSIHTTKKRRKHCDDMTDTK